MLVLLALHEEADLPTGAGRVSIDLSALWVVQERQVAHMKRLSCIHWSQDDLVPDVDLEGVGTGHWLPSYRTRAGDLVSVL